MRVIIIGFILLCSSYCVTAQPITDTFTQAKQEGISFTELDSLYPSAAHAHPTKGVFNKDQASFLKKYRTMMQEFGQFLNENNFQWGNRTSFFQRIYFDKNGSIDYYFVNLDQTHFSDKKRKQFLKLLHAFSEKYQFPMQAESNFAQCAPITFVDPKSTEQKSNR
ncbi:hypothetical protein [Fodinibius halophilus]|uniref:Uncharacterized protein n=1 Tax=Fodinibius halophilus TaxID=1736908 RepID=A0A6M1TEC1_9BACT|nr:hypothetical protein [Fodinibius halophilus]NGP88532.1 hypothetical protein [Fodinibius halophilus]